MGLLLCGCDWFLFECLFVGGFIGFNSVVYFFYYLDMICLCDLAAVLQFSWFGVYVARLVFIACLDVVDCLYLFV